jgi:flavodoxin
LKKIQYFDTLNILIVYLTRTQATKNIALQFEEILKKQNSVEFLEISEKKKYHFLKFTFAPVGKENVNISSVLGSPMLYLHTFTKKRAKIEDISVNFEKFDLIVFGTPIWYGHLPPAVNTFIYKYGPKISKKKIFIFVTSGCGKGYTNYINVLRDELEKNGLKSIGQLHKLFGTYLTDDDKKQILNSIK